MENSHYATVRARGVLPDSSSLNSDTRTLQLDHFEIFLARAALRARPVRRHVFPFRPGGDALVGGARGLVIDPAADQAHVFLQVVFRKCRGVRYRQRRRVPDVRFDRDYKL